MAKRNTMLFAQGVLPGYMKHGRNAKNKLKVFRGQNINPFLQSKKLNGILAEQMSKVAHLNQ